MRGRASRDKQARDGLTAFFLRLREGVELLAHRIDGGPARCLQGGNVGLNLREFKSIARSAPTSSETPDVRAIAAFVGDVLDLAVLCAACSVVLCGAALRAVRAALCDLVRC